MRIKIKTGSVEVIAELDETNTARTIYNALPIYSRVNLWGEEVYFSIPVHIELEDGREVVDSGDLGFWPSGDAFCIFFGRTPVSGEGEIRPASAVNVFGKITGDPTIFRGAKSGEKITVTPLSGI